jgi:hypothetical protein
MTSTITPVFPLSMFDPVHLGMDENGEQVHVNLAERNMLLGGEPGAGKSNALNLIVAHAALSSWTRGASAPTCSSDRPSRRPPPHFRSSRPS